jgi:hypothetical protein
LAFAASVLAISGLQEPVLPVKAIAPLVSALRADSAIGLLEQSSDSIEIEVGSLTAGSTDAVVDSVRRMTPLRLSFGDNVACADGDELASAVARARCALRAVPVYVEIRDFVAAGSRADARVLVARRVPPLPRVGSWPRHVVSTVGRVLHRASPRVETLSFNTYDAQLTLSDSAAWRVTAIERVGGHR